MQGIINRYSKPQKEMEKWRNNNRWFLINKPKINKHNLYLFWGITIRSRVISRSYEGYRCNYGDRLSEIIGKLGMLLVM